MGVDYNDYLPWIVNKQIEAVYSEISKRYDKIYILANSIGAYFAMNTLQDYCIEKALFISPILDMEKLIFTMMNWANVSEIELQKQRKFLQNLEKLFLGSICVMLEIIQSNGIFQPKYFMPKMTILQIFRP